MHRGRFIGLVLLVPALMGLTAGCVRGGAAFGTGWLVGIAMSQAFRAGQPPANERVAVATSALETPPATQLASPDAAMAPVPSATSTAVVAVPQYGGDHAGDDAGFDPLGGLSTLQSADLTGCRARGMPGDTVHAFVTFGSTGTVRSIVVDAPAGLSPDAVACLGEQIGAVSVASFDGADETLSATWSMP